MVGRTFIPLPWARSLFGNPVGRLQHLHLLRRISSSSPGFVLATGVWQGLSITYEARMVPW